jgi:putative ABC transport system permease protein
MRDVLAQVLRELGADRFRTRLSLLGVAVGIFSIVAALTLVDAVQESIRAGFSAYGGDVLFVDREPLEPDLNEDGQFRWWAYAQRPAVSWREFRYLQERGAGEAFASIAYAGYGASCVGVAGDWRLLVQQPLSAGRGFTERELQDALPVVIVGSKIESRKGVPLHCGDPLWIEGSRYEVIGIFDQAGFNTISTVDVDQVRLIPTKSQQKEWLRSCILLSDADETKVRSLMRECRRLGPLQEDDFALNRLSFLLEEMNDIFRMVARLGWIVGIFSLLVGGFGIANMLYVSVEERKPQIGICRALGARRQTIVRQFLAEAAILSLLGGISGIIFIQILLLMLGQFIDFLPMIVSAKALVSGILVSMTLGLVFGVSPARHAAHLQPVDLIKG